MIGNSPSADAIAILPSDGTVSEHSTVYVASPILTKSCLSGYLMDKITFLSASSFSFSSMADKRVDIIDAMNYSTQAALAAMDGVSRLVTTKGLVAPREASPLPAKSLIITNAEFTSRSQVKPHFSQA